MGLLHVRGLAAIVAALTIVGTACGAPSTPSGASGAAASAATPAGGPIKGGTLVMAIWQEPANLMPHYANQTVQSVVLDAIVEGLVKTAANGDYVPVLAKELPTVGNGGVKVSADGKTMDVTYHLRPGIKWSDGQPLTSADVQFTWRTIMDDPKTAVRSGYDQITGIDTPDDLTAVVHYKSVYAAYPTRFGRLLAKHALQGIAPAELSKSDYVRKPLGTGPFMITDFKAGDSFTLVRNPYYREAGKPYLDKVIFKSVPSSAVAIAQLKAGEVQAMWNLLESESADVEKAGVHVVVTPGPSVERIEFNTAENKDGTDPNSKHPVLGDINVRRALIYATPKQQIIDKLLYGKATVGTTVLSTGWAAPKDVTQEGYDPKKANELLDQAGWVKGADGIRSKNGVRASLEITTTTGNKTREQVEQVLVEEWKQIGVELKIQNIPSAVLLSASWAANDPRKKGSLDMWMYASSPDIDPDSIIYERYYSKKIPWSGNNGDGQNYTRVNNAELDKAIEASRSTLDFDKRKAAYDTVCKVLNQEAVIDWLYNRADINGFTKNVQGVGGGNPWRVLTDNIEDWWLSK
ncbi:MAG: peptide ABC transporter substrate-binding protein [Chloroflexota bacterium]|nr:peptide ABC transporter substrate-binding protein [Chloroflexota bacterium]MDE3193397.1 peptide ABC transporter substrate-binding protein [Chloroflexota bacterium]